MNKNYKESIDHIKPNNSISRVLERGRDPQASKDYIELQEYIESIVSTAKLLGYETSIDQTNLMNMFVTIEKDGYIVATFILYLDPHSRILLKTSHKFKDEMKFMVNQSTEEKLNHLQSILELL